MNVTTKYVKSMICEQLQNALLDGLLYRLSMMDTFITYWFNV